MNKIYLRVGLCLLMCAFALQSSHAQGVVWAKDYGGKKKDKGRDIGVDQDGNSYVVGFFTDSVNFGNDPYGNPIYINTVGDNSDEDIFIVKLNPDGDPLWAHSMGNGISNHTDFPFGFSVSPDGHAVITGNCENNMIVDDGTEVDGYGDDDMFLALYDAQGSLQWLKVGGGTGIDMGTGVFIDDNDMIYATGNTVGDFNIFGDSSYIDTSYAHHVYVSQYDLSGTLQWSRVYTSQYNFEARDITGDNNGFIYVGGNFAYNITFDNAGGLSALGSDDGWIAKLGTNNGLLQWTKSFGSSDVSSYEAAYTLSVDTLGNLYTATVFKSNIIFDLVDTITTGLEHNIAVAKWDASGVYQWGNVIKGGNQGDFSVFCLGLLAEDNIILTGCFAGDDWVGIDNNFEILPYGDPIYADAFYAAFDPATGIPAWAMHVGGESTDAGYGLTGNKSSYGYASGHFRDDATFGPFSLTSSGVSDIYIIKFHESTPTGTVSPSLQSIAAYPNPASDQLNILIPVNVNQLQIVNLFGQVVLQEDISNAGLKTYDVHALAAGMYSIQLTGNNISYTATLVKQ